MKILHVIWSVQKAAGTSVFVVELCDALREQGQDVAIADCVPCAADRYPSRTGLQILDLEQVLRGDCKWNVVHLHGIWSPVLHRASVWAHRKGVPVVWSPHGMLAPWAMAHKRWKKVLPWFLYQRRDLKGAALLHATSDEETKWFRDLGFTQASVVVPLGTHLPPLVGRREHSVKTLLFVGRIYPVKGLANLLAAWAQLPLAVRQNWLLKLVGPDQAGYMETLKRQAERLGLTGGVTFAGPLYGADLAGAYRDADALVLPSFTENFGGVVVDAMANGLPVVASKFTPWQELEIIGAGWWTDNKPDPLAEVLGDVMALSDDERAAMGARGRKLVEEKYTWPAIGAQMFAAYREVFGRGDGEKRSDRPN